MRAFLVLAVVFLTACGGHASVVPNPALAGVGHARGRAVTHAVRPRPYFRAFASLPDPDLIEDGDIDANIDQDVQGADRNAIRDVMRKLRKTERKNVVLITDGRAIANHKALLHGATLTQPQGQLVRLAGGQEIAFPPYTKATDSAARRALGGPMPPNSDNTGPFRRNYDANDGYSEIIASPSLPCNASPFMSTGAWYGPYHDNGYVYFSNQTYSDQFEAGMFYQASGTTNDYIPYQTDANDGGGFFTLSAQYAMACGQNSNPSNLTMTMTWAIAAQDLLATHFRGYNTAHQIVDVTISRTPSGLGWYNNCSSCTVSTMTTIAQSSGGPGGYWPDGWYFGTNPDAFEPSIGWFGVQVGHCNANSSTSTDCSLQPNPGPVPFRQSFPNDPNQILTSPGDSFSYWSERDGIAVRLDYSGAPLSPSYDAAGDAYPNATPTPQPPPTCGRSNCPQ